MSVTIDVVCQSNKNLLSPCSKPIQPVRTRLRTSKVTRTVRDCTRIEDMQLLSEYLLSIDY